MNDSKMRRWTGAFGAASGLFLVAAMAIYLLRQTPPLPNT